MTAEMGVALDLMRIEGICKMLIQSIDLEALEGRFLSVSGQAHVDNVKQALSLMSKADLRKIIEKSPEITDDVIRSFYDEYRYGRKPGFVLYWANGLVGKAISEKELKSSLVTYLESKRYNPDARYKDLKLVGVTTWSESGFQVHELGLSYLKKYSFITEKNQFDYIHELVDCFGWINAEKGFVALYNMPPTIERILKSFILDTYGVKLLGLSLDRKILDEIFDPCSRTKISLTQYSAKGSRPQKATFSDPDLASKQDSLLAEYQEYDVGSALYNEGIDENVTATLGINSHRGKLYINKNLTTTQFRGWSVRRIVTIIEYFSNIFSETGIEKFERIQVFNSGKWERISTTKRTLLKKIAFSILCCKQKGLSSFPVKDVSAVDIVRQFSNDICYCPLITCDVCGETGIPECPHCGSRSLNVLGTGAAICQNCGKPLTVLKCECGHYQEFENPNDYISITFKDTFLTNIVEELRIAIPEIIVAKEECISVYRNQIHVLKATNYSRLNPSDITEFKKLYMMTISEKQVEKAKEVLRRIKEKCNKSPTNEKCEKCKYKPMGSLAEIECMQQLFCYFEEFIPKPHQGQEYGDLSITIHIGNAAHNLQGIMKSQTTKITRSSNTGREILDQTLKGMLDHRTDIIAIIAPAVFDDQLKETLNALGKRFCRKIVFLDADFMYRLVVATEERIAMPQHIEF